MSNSRERSEPYKDLREPTEDLDRQYHMIGIPAVRAALRYHGDVPTEPQSDSHDTAHKAA
jgi:hypothetical protein